MDQEKIESKRKSKLMKIDSKIRNSSLGSQESDQKSIQRAKIIERLNQKKFSVFSNSALSQIDSKTGGNSNSIVAGVKGASALNQMDISRNIH